MVPARLIAERGETVPLHSEPDRFPLLIPQTVIGIDVDKNTHSEWFLVFHADLIAVIADAGDHIRIFRTCLAVEHLQMGVFPDVDVQIFHKFVVIGARHHDVHIIVPRDKSMVSHSADQGPVDQIIPQILLLADPGHRVQYLQRDLLRILHGKRL